MPSKLPDNDGWSVLHWAPDGSRLLYLSRGGMSFFFSATGVQLACQRLSAGAHDVVWAASGAVAVLYGQELELYSLEETAEDQPLLVPACKLSCSDLGVDVLHPCQPAFSPDGAHLACVANCSDGLVVVLIDVKLGSLLFVHILDLDTRQVPDQQLALHQYPETCWWSADGSRLAVTHFSLSGGFLHVVDIGT